MQRMALVILRRADKTASQLFLLFHGLDEDPGSTLIFKKEPLGDQKEVLHFDLPMCYRVFYTKGDGNNNNCHLLRIYYKPRTGTHAVHISYFIFRRKLGSRCYYHLTDNKFEAQSSQLTLSKVTHGTRGRNEI